MDESLSVENRILLGCARRNVDFDGLGALVDAGAPAHRSVNWEALLAAARAHHLLPLLYEGLAEVGGDRVPAEVMAHLRGAYYANLLRNQRLLAELAEVVDALRRAGIEAIVLKGGALAPAVYAHPAQRPMADLDLLVRPGAMERTGAVLRSLGFCLSTTMSAALVAFHERYGGGLEYVRSHGGGMTRLDVQHDLVRTNWCRASFLVDPGTVWEAARPLTLHGTEAWQLSVEDTLIHLCLHLSVPHAYDCPLLGYVDLDRVISTVDGGFSWLRLVERAQRFRIKTVVYRGLHSTRYLLGTPVPDEVLAALEPGDLHLRILHWLAPLDREAVLQMVNARVRGPRRVLLYAALADHLKAAGWVVRNLLFPGKEWLATRYSLGSRCRIQLYCLAHPLRVTLGYLWNRHWPLVDISLD